MLSLMVSTGAGLGWILSPMELKTATCRGAHLNDCARQLMQGAVSWRRCLRGDGLQQLPTDVPEARLTEGAPVLNLCPAYDAGKAEPADAS